jgi:hypothetical protein
VATTFKSVSSTEIAVRISAVGRRRSSSSISACAASEIPRRELRRAAADAANREIRERRSVARARAWERMLVIRLSTYCGGVARELRERLCATTRTDERLAILEAELLSRLSGAAVQPAVTCEVDVLARARGARR